jgi:hypothetical protein
MPAHHSSPVCSLCCYLAHFITFLPPSLPVPPLVPRPLENVLFLALAHKQTQTNTTLQTTAVFAIVTTGHGV